MTSFVFFRYLFSSKSGALIKSISWICIVGVAVSVFAMIMILSIMNGFNDQIFQRILRSESHIVIDLKKANQSFEKVQDQVTELYSQQKNLPKASLNQYWHIFESHYQDVIVKTVDSLFSGAKAIGLSQEEFRDLMKRLDEANPQKTLQNLPSNYDLKENEVFLAADLANQLAIFRGDFLNIVSPESILLPAGEIPVYDSLIVAEIIATKVNSVDSNVIYYNKDQALLKLKDSLSLTTNFEIRFVDAKDSDLLLAKLKDLFPGAVQSWQERNSAFLYALKLEKIMMALMLGITLLIASISIVTVLNLVISQKRKDIALMRAIGLSDDKVKKLFAGIGLSLSAFGAGIGFVLGVLLCTILQKYPLSIFPSDIYYDSLLPVQMNWWVNIGVLVFAIFIAAVGSWLPAHLSVLESIAENLKMRALRR